MPKSSNGKGPVFNAHDFPIEPDYTNAIPYEFFGHINLKQSTPFHAVGQGAIDLYPNPQNPAFEVEIERVNFVLNDKVLNAVAHTDDGVLHYNSRTGKITGQGDLGIPLDGFLIF
jgi:hypothetical protein